MNKCLGDLLDRLVSLEENDVILAIRKYSTTNLTSINKEHENKSLNVPPKFSFS